MRRPPRGTLAWRLYALGLVQLVLLGGAVIGVGYLLRPARGPEPGMPDDGRARHGFHRGEPPPPPPNMPPLVPPLGPPPPGPPGPPGRPGPVAPLLTFFFSGLVILGIGSLLTARWIVRPLEELSRTARALGGGDLRARTGLNRDDELGDVARAFDEMADRLQALRGTERELLANVSHELRTPLARIRVALEIAGEGDAETGRVSMTEIGVDLVELEGLIDDVLTAARLELADGQAPASGFPLHKDEIGPDVLCARAIERFRARHPLRAVELVTAPDLPAIEVDPVLFRRVLDNLLENAHKYSPDPSLSVALRASRRGENVVFEVADKGMGIGAEDLPHVFAPFFRGDRSRSRGTGGVGLGLTLAKRIVVAHGGEIEVTSAAGVGTTVSVVVPAAPARA